MLNGGNAAMDFLPSRSSISSFGLALMKANFMQALLFLYSFTTAHKALGNNQNILLPAQ
jgi:hypothetical protein